jgi:hypothetical protein
MRPRRVSAFLPIILSMLAFADAAHAQQGLTVGADVIFYGDNTEFQNPFREGETIFGASARLDGRVEMSDAVTLSLGVFGNSRFGGDSFELVRPVIAMTVMSGPSRFIFGTLATPVVGEPRGPDRTGPHGLLPPLQRETLAFDRPYEAGLQWTLKGPAYEHDTWLQWQRLNTPEHRERLDAGARVQWRMGGPFSLPVQMHIVHEGGQLHASGPVRDSVALASGIAWSRREADSASGSGPREQPIVVLDPSIEVLGLWSHDTPDREQPQRTRNGGAFFARAAVEGLAWRAHLIVWRGDDFIKVEGDPNYMSIRRDGSRYRGVRDYAEAGIARTFALVPGALIEASFRFHRVERDYEYSYRILGVVRARARLK